MNKPTRGHVLKRVPFIFCLSSSPLSPCANLNSEAKAEHMEYPEGDTLTIPPDSTRFVLITIK